MIRVLVKIVALQIATGNIDTNSTYTIEVTDMRTIISLLFHFTRTIIGETQEEYQMSSSGSSPRGGGGDFRERNDLIGDVSA